MNIQIAVNKKLLALAPGAEGSRCGPLVLQKGTWDGADGVSIGQAHKVNGTGECCSLARLHDPLTDRSRLLEQGPVVSGASTGAAVGCQPSVAPPWVDKDRVAPWGAPHNRSLHALPWDAEGSNEG